MHPPFEFVMIKVQFVQIVLIIFAINMLIIHKKKIKNRQTIKQNYLGTIRVAGIAQEKEDL